MAEVASDRQRTRGKRGLGCDVGPATALVVPMVDLPGVLLQDG